MKRSLYLLLVLILAACKPNSPTWVDLDNAQASVGGLDRERPVLVENRYNAAFLIMDGVYNTELTAPYDIFQHTIFRDSIKAMNVFLVAQRQLCETGFHI